MNKHLHSVIYNDQSKTGTKFKIDSIIDRYKQLLKFDLCSNSHPIPSQTEKLNIAQAKAIEALSKHANTYEQKNGQKHNHSNNKRNLHLLLRSYQLQNQQQGIQQIDSSKWGLFREGVYYRSTTRTRGSAVTPLDHSSLRDYFQRMPEEDLIIPSTQALSTAKSQKVNRNLRFSSNDSLHIISDASKSSYSQQNRFSTKKRKHFPSTLSNKLQPIGSHQYTQKDSKQFPLSKIKSTQKQRAERPSNEYRRIRVRSNINGLE